jgi:hypothetical protein
MFYGGTQVFVMFAIDDIRDYLLVRADRDIFCKLTLGT